MDLVQERRNSSVLAMELHLSCTKPYEPYQLTTVTHSFTPPLMDNQEFILQILNFVLNRGDSISFLINYQLNLETVNLFTHFTISFP